MRTEQTAMVVLEDGDGAFYLIPRETLEQLRVTTERQAELARVLGDDDATGFAVWPNELVESNPEAASTFRV
ncbi:MAG: hypothetical protein H0V00_15500, partial [Chloroflexia bacterium]|nr:hypothetical protein [Chloroflexia bacterium]